MPNHIFMYCISVHLKLNLDRNAQSLPEIPSFPLKNATKIPRPET